MKSYINKKKNPQRPYFEKSLGFLIYDKVDRKKYEKYLYTLSEDDFMYIYDELKLKTSQKNKGIWNNLISVIAVCVLAVGGISIFSGLDALKLGTKEGDKLAFAFILLGTFLVVTVMGIAFISYKRLDYNDLKFNYVENMYKRKYK